MTTRIKPLALAVAVLLAAADVQAESNTAATTDANADAAATPSFDAAQAETLDSVSVVGERQTRQVQIVRAEALRAQAPGINPLKGLDKLPGVHFVSSDPWGSYEWSSRIAIRGFNQNQLGYTLDGIPLGDNSYANSNGLSPNRAITAENLAGMDLAQGAGALATASTSNLGGTVALRSSDPQAQFGLRSVLAFGGESVRRGYARIDTGDLGGFSAYISGLSQDSEKWKGEGEQDQRQFNTKLVYAWESGRISAWFDVSRRNETDDADLSLNLLSRCGWGWDNYAPDWNRALAAARGQFSGCVTSKDDAYFAARGLRDDDLAAIAGDFWFNDALNLRATGYYHRNEGQGHWFTPHIASPTIPMALRVTSYDIERSGVITALAYSTDTHAIEGGVWSETGVHGAGRSYVAIDGPIDDARFFGFNEFAGRLFRQRFDTDTLQWYLQDSWTLMDGRLRLNYGFKGQDIVTDAVVVVPGRAGGQLKTRDSFLPQAGLAYRLDEKSDLFFNYTENQAAFRPGVNGAWSLSQAAFNQSRATARPEQSQTLELGWRHAVDGFQASATVYGVNFKDRQLVIVPCPGVVSCPNQFANVGKARSVGAELAAVWKVSDSLDLLASYAYNDATYRDDYRSSGALVAVAGKQMVDSPKHLFATEATWHAGDFSLRLGAKYTGERYYTYTNDAGVPGYWLWDAGASWERADLGWAQRLKLALNVYNLADKKYISTLGSNGFRDYDPSGTFATLLQGAPRQVFFSADVQF